LSAAEAALCGCVVVANDLPSYREVWGDDANFFRRNDARALAATLDRLYDHPTEAATYAAAAQRRVASRYTVERMVDSYLKLYHRVLALPRSPSWGALPASHETQPTRAAQSAAVS